MAIDQLEELFHEELKEARWNWYESFLFQKNQVPPSYLEGLLVAFEAPVAGDELASDLLEEDLQRWKRRILHLPVLVRAECDQPF